VFESLSLNSSSSFIRLPSLILKLIAVENPAPNSKGVEKERKTLRASLP